MYGSRVTSYHDSVIRRLKQLRGLSIVENTYDIDENQKRIGKPRQWTESTFITSLSSRIDEDTNAKMITTNLSEWITTNYIARQTMALNRDKLAIFAPGEQEFVFFVQTIRYNFFNIASPSLSVDQMNEKKDQECLVTYQQFTSNLTLEAKRKAFKHKYIQSMLQSLKKSNFLIEDYRVLKDSYYLKFTPVEESECPSSTSLSIE